MGSPVSVVVANLVIEDVETRAIETFAHTPDFGYATQRWSPRGRPWPRGHPRGHILKSLALASRPQVFENWPVLGSRTALFFGMLKFCGALEKFFGKRFLVEIA